MSIVRKWSGDGLTAGPIGDITTTQFLLARIAEDEAVARGSSAVGPWRYDPTKVNSVDGGEAVFAGPRGAMGITIASTGPADDPQSMRDARHIARHDPARVLAECEAKRRIVELIRRDNGDWCSPDRLGLGEMVLETLALPYADHPDYRDEWRP